MQGDWAVEESCYVFFTVTQTGTDHHYTVLEWRRHYKRKKLTSSIASFKSLGRLGTL